jgi:hypothetical protein
LCVKNSVPRIKLKNKINEKMASQTLSELVKTADKITIDQIKGKKVTLKISWFDLKGVRKSKKFLLNEKDNIEF